MEIVTTGPYRTAALVWRPRAGFTAVTLVCKATWDLRPDRSPLSAEPEEVLAVDSPAMAPAAAALSLATDLVPAKRWCDVLLTGHAFAPEGTRVTSLSVRLAIGAIDKGATVWGDRYLRQDGTVSDPAPFSRSPLLWERAAGGPETANPAGVPFGREARPDLWGRIALPTVLAPGVMLGSIDDMPSPVGFGPIAPGWPARAQRLHRHVAAWDPARWHESPLPEDFDFAFFNVAPWDQQCDELTGEETIYLENLHPRWQHLSTRLVPLPPRAFVRLGRMRREEVRLRADTLAIDTDRSTATLVYRAHVIVEAQRGTPSFVVEPSNPHTPYPGAKPGAPITAPVPASAAPPGLSPEMMEGMAAFTHAMEGRDVRSTVKAESVHVGTALPFSQREPPASAGLPFVASDDDEDVTNDGPPTVRHHDSVAPAAPVAPPAPDVRALPFRPQEGRVGGSALGRSMRLGGATSAPPPPPPSAADEPPPPNAADMGPRRAMTLMINDAATPAAVSSSGALPFEPTPFGSAPFEPTPFAAAPLPPAPAPPPPFEPPLPFASAPPPPAPFAPVPFEPAPEFATTAQALHAAARSRAAEAPPSSAVEDEPTMDVAPAGVAPPEPAPAETPAAASAEPAPPPVDEAPPPLPLDDYPAERCARIDARLACHPDAAHDILDENELTKETWERLRAHWQDRIAAESARGRHKQLAAYDQAYVAQVEEERGPIQTAELARWTVAAETGTLDAELKDTGVPREAWMRIQRLWIVKRARDPKCRKELRDAIFAVREG